MKKRWTYIIIAILTIMIALYGAFHIYTRNYYHSEEEVQNYLSDTEKIDVVIDDNEDDITFIPGGQIKAGLIFYPGAKVEYTAYSHLMKKLAEQGILCVLLHVPGNLAFLDIHASDDIIKRWPDIKHWYLCGHSLGGVAAEMCLNEHVDDGIYDGIIFLASYGTKDISDTGLRVLSIYGEKDQVLNMEKMKENRKNLPSNAEEYIISGGNHAYFGHYGEQQGDGEATILSEEQCEETAQVILQWIEEGL